MRLFLEGEWRSLTPIRAFREAHHLPADFGMARFAPKDFDGLARLDEAGEALSALRAAVLGALRPGAPLLAQVGALAHAFEDSLRQHNPHIGLHESEIEYAVGGLRDALETYAYARLHPSQAQQPFEQVYGRWVGESARLAQDVQHMAGWRVQVITTVYGRAGLRAEAEAGDVVAWLSDAAFACPAEGFMGRLLAEIAQASGA